MRALRELSEPGTLSLALRPTIEQVVGSSDRENCLCVPFPFLAPFVSFAALSGRVSVVALTGKGSPLARDSPAPRLSAPPLSTRVRLEWSLLLLLRLLTPIAFWAFLPRERCVCVHTKPTEAKQERLQFATVKLCLWLATVCA